MNFDADFIDLHENDHAVEALPDVGALQAVAPAASTRLRMTVMMAAAAMGLIGATASVRHFVGGKKATAAKGTACAVKLGTVMPVDSFTSKGAAMTQIGGARSGFHLTFDDGPHPVHTPALLDWLKTNRIQATFFVTGKNAERHPELVRRIAAEGHQIGNHTWSHANLTKLSDARAHSEIERTHDLIVKITGRAPTVFRPPYGALTTAQRLWVTSALHYATVLWNVDTEDWKLSSPAAITQRIERTLKPGGIILAHDIHPRILQALPLVLPKLEARGLKPVPLLSAVPTTLAAR